jgi:hypothetical protein
VDFLYFLRVVFVYAANIWVTQNARQGNRNINPYRPNKTVGLIACRRLVNRANDRANITCGLNAREGNGIYFRYIPNIPSRSYARQGNRDALVSLHR